VILGAFRRRLSSFEAATPASFGGSSVITNTVDRRWLDTHTLRLSGP
jgi:hypothetical protein